MHATHKIKLVTLLTVLALLSSAVGLVLYALKQNINLFYTPTELSQTTLSPGQTVRIGGYVKLHSVAYTLNGQAVNFTVTDRVHEIAVQYAGVLPNLFREGQTVVVTGQLQGRTFRASQVLAKHDETYRPKSLATHLPEGRTHAS